MNIEEIQAFVKEYPKGRCLFCANFVLDTKTCSVNATIPCGRAFNPKGPGGSTSNLIPV